MGLEVVEESDPKCGDIYGKVAQLFPVFSQSMESANFITSKYSKRTPVEPNAVGPRVCTPSHSECGSENVLC